MKIYIYFPLNELICSYNVCCVSIKYYLHKWAFKLTRHAKCKLANAFVHLSCSTKLAVIIYWLGEKEMDPILGKLCSSINQLNVMLRLI